MDFGAAVRGGGEQLERAAAVGPGAVAQMAKRGERGIGEREHARVYPNARSDAAAARKTNARVGLQWCHSLGKSVCFSMCAGSAYWCHLSAKSSVISTNGTIRSESTRQLACPRLSLPPFANAAIAASRVASEPRRARMWALYVQTWAEYDIAEVCHRSRGRPVIRCPLLV